jgi:hypothetical protein
LEENIQIYQKMGAKTLDNVALLTLVLLKCVDLTFGFDNAVGSQICEIILGGCNESNAKLDMSCGIGWFVSWLGAAA